jgi:NodT family efflux transporter outer membrane factor (OMF) lipoprotein
MLLVLPSCVLSNYRLADPGPLLPPTYNGVASPENSALLKPESFFNDPTLTHLIYQGLAGNQELKILNEEVQVARNEILARSGAYLPFVTFGASTGVEKNSDYTPLGAAEKDLEYAPGKHFPDPVPDFLLGFRLFWELDIWRALRNARDAAGQRYLAASERRNYFVTRLVADIADNYYQLQSLDQRISVLETTIQLFEDSLKAVEAKYKVGRSTQLPVFRFQAEVRKYQSELRIVRQEIVEAENRINFLLGRYPQPVQRNSAGFLDLTLNALCVGVPAQLLQNRRDIQQAERELEAAGLDVKVARAHFFPRVDINAAVGYEAFNPKYLFNTPAALVYNAAGELVAPLINKRAIRADYFTANAKQLQTVYNYQRVILNAFTEVINRLAGVANYSRSIEIRRQQLASLESAVDSANKLFLAARVEYIEVLLARRDLQEARTVLVQTKYQQLSAFVNAYQALGGGAVLPILPQGPAPSDSYCARPF